MPANHVRVGVQAIVHNADGRLLMAKRARGFGKGTWGIPGGHLEPGETITECALRELHEETGIRGHTAQVFCVSDPDPTANHHMQIGVVITSHEGEPQITDPDEVAAIRYFSWDHLPDAIFPPALPVLNGWRTGQIHQPAPSAAPHLKLQLATAKNHPATSDR